MAKVVSTGYTDTAIAGNPVLNLLRGSLNFLTDFRVKTDVAGKEIVLTNLTSPVDRPEKIRIAYSEIANCYTGSGIDPSVAAPTKGGVSVLAQLTEVISVSDDTDPNYRIDLPVSYHLVIKVPRSEYITPNLVQTGLARLLSVVYETGVTTTTRISGLLRGSLKPADV